MISRPSAGPPAPARPRLWTSQFTALILAQVCFGYAFSSYFLLPTFLSRELGASASLVGWVMSLTSGAVVVLLPIVGRAADRTGRRVFLALGALLMALASLGFMLVDEVGPLLFLLRFIQAVSFAMVFAAGGALTVDLAPPERVGQAVGLFGMTFLAMNGVASACVERIAQSAGWDSAFGAAAATAFASALLSLRLRDSRRASAEPGGAAGAPARGPGPAVPLAPLAIMSSCGLALGAMFGFAQLYAAALGTSGVSLFFVAYAVGGVFVRSCFGHLLDEWDTRKVAIGALCAYIAVVAATIRLDWFGLVAIGAALGLAHGLFYPSLTTLTLKETHASARGRVIAYVQSAFSVGGIATAGLGMVADRLGYPAVFAIAAAGLLAGLCALVARRPRAIALAAPELISASEASPVPRP